MDFRERRNSISQNKSACRLLDHGGQPIPGAPSSYELRDPINVGGNAVEGTRHAKRCAEILGVVLELTFSMLHRGEFSQEVRKCQYFQSLYQSTVLHTAQPSSRLTVLARNDSHHHNVRPGSSFTLASKSGRTLQYYEGGVRRTQLAMTCCAQNLPGRL